MALRLLVVDDDPDVRKALRTMLRTDRHEVHLAANAEDALACFEAGRFDMVIVDYSMPGMNGAELAAVIKQRDPKQPVLMITAYVETFDGTPKGVDMMLGKPFAFEALRAAVAKLVPSAGQAD